MSRMLSFKLFAGFIGMLAIVAAMAFAYRSATIQDIVDSAEKYNVALAQGALDPDRSALAAYLTAVSAVAGGDVKSVPHPPALDEALGVAMRDSSVRRIKIYNRTGAVCASTSTGQIGGVQADNPGFKAAINGDVFTNLVTRGAPNRFEDGADDHNLVDTYIPVRLHPGELILGVVEIYTDVNAAVIRADRAAIEVFAVAVLILGGLATVVLLFGLRAGGSPRASGEKGTLLELLSDRNLRREELARKKLAVDLHEGLAQSLSAIKMAVETAENGNTGSAGHNSLKSVVSELQVAIQRVREMATGLRPSGLDDFGLIATIKSLCREFGELYPGIRIGHQINGQEALVPAPLKIVIYRNIEAALKIIGEQSIATSVRVSLQISEDALTLAITDNRTVALPPAGYVDLDVNTESPFSPIRERTVISGGQLSMSRNNTGAIELRARWRRPPKESRNWKW